MTLTVLLILVALVTGFAVACLLFWRGRGNEAADVLFYRQQLRELERQSDAEVGSDGDIEAARIELGRRLIRAGSRERASMTDSPSMRRWAAMLSVMILAATFAVYWQLGAPDLAGRPSAGTGAAADAPVDDADAPSMDELLRRLEARLEANSGDARGWALLARSLLATGRGSEAARAFETAIALAPDDAELKIGLGEALVQIGDGLVTPAARLAFIRAARILPDHPGPAFYLGLAALQSGNVDRALAIWTDLEDRTPEGAPWLSDLKRRIELARAQRQDIPGSGATPLTEEQIAAVRELSPEDQRAFIQSMLSRLEARLAENPDDWRGWLQLARSKRNFGDTVGALAALNRARAAAPPDAAGLLKEEAEALSLNEVSE